MKTSLIAKIVHTINAAYCLSQGDDSQKPWDEAPEWQKESAVKGVEFVLANPDAPESATHDSWLAQKTADGWVYGEEKDEEAKTHQCIVPFEELPAEQKAKDYIFRATVKAVAEALDNLPPVVQPAPPVESGVRAKPAAPVKPAGAPLGFTPVEYIGLRDSYTDGTYGTRITWNKGESKLVPDAQAAQLLKHADVYRIGGVEGAETAVINEPAKDKDDITEQDLQDARDAVANMDGEALRSYAAINFSGHKLHPKLGVDKARLAVIGLIDQFGITK